MDGRGVFKRAVRVMVDSAKRTLEQAKVRPEEVKLLVPHQANIRIIQSACDRLGIDREKAALVMHRTGNTSSASIPLALVDAIEQGPERRREATLASADATASQGSGFAAAIKIYLYNSAASPLPPPHTSFWPILTISGKNRLIPRW